MEKDKATALKFDLLSRIYQSPLHVLIDVMLRLKLVMEEDVGTLNPLKAQIALTSFIEEKLVKEDGVDMLEEMEHILPRVVMHVLPKDMESTSTLVNGVNKTEKTETVTNLNGEVSKLNIYRKDFKINGQINEKNGIAFLTLIRQIENAEAKGFTSSEIVDGVLRSIAPSSPLRTYLEGRQKLTLSSLRGILRSHYKEKSASDLYQELGSTCQKKSEEPSDYLLRLLALKQKIIFVSQEVGEVNYDPELIDNIFRRTFYSGLLDETIRREIQPLLKQTVIPDEELMQSLSEITSLEKERKARIKSVTVNPIQKEERKLEQTLTDLRTQVAKLTEVISNNSNNSSNSKPQNRKYRKPWGCKSCAEAGQGATCRHCWVCGSSDHFKVFHSENATRSPQGGKK